MAALISSSRLLSPRLQKEDGEGREGYYQVLSIVVISGAVLTLARNLIFKRKTPFHLWNWLLYSAAFVAPINRIQVSKAGTTLIAFRADVSTYFAPGELT